MKYLLDANIWLDILTDGPHSAESMQLLRQSAPGTLATTDFSVHTVALILTPREPALFREFIDDLVEHRVFTLHLAPTDLLSVVTRMTTHALDFDDAFQYLCAEREDLRIVSFDTDFDRTTRGRMTPAQVLAELANP